MSSHSNLIVKIRNWRLYVYILYEAPQRKCEKVLFHYIQTNSNLFKQIKNLFKQIGNLFEQINNLFVHIG